MVGAVQVVLIRLLWENSAISIAEDYENWLFSCLTAPCKAAFLQTLTQGPLLIPTPWGCHLWHAFSQITMEQEERMEIIMSQVCEGWHTCCPLSWPQLSLLAPLTPRKCSLAGKWNMFGDQLALLLPRKKNNFLLWDRAVCYQQVLYFYSPRPTEPQWLREGVPSGHLRWSKQLHVGSGA